MRSNVGIRVVSEGGLEHSNAGDFPESGNSCPSRYTSAPSGAPELRRGGVRVNFVGNQDHLREAARQRIPSECALHADDGTSVGRVAALQASRRHQCARDQRRYSNLSMRPRSECCATPQNLALTSHDPKRPTFLTHTHSGRGVPGLSVPLVTLRVMDWKIELVAIPVTDVDRAKAFYVEQVGFHADHDYQVNDELRFVQLTPPGSACSVVLGTGITEMPPGSQKGVQGVVDDVTAGRRDRAGRGVEVSEVDVQPWGSFVTFSDPDGNTWALQQLPPRG